jgi:hypothetical protein
MLINNSVVKKTNGITVNPTTTLKLIYISPIECAFQDLSVCIDRSLANEV